MKTEDIDKIIAEALEAEKQQGKKHGHHKRHGNSTSIRNARKLLNVLFMAGFIAAIIIYFACPEQRVLFFCVGFGAMVLKIIEFCLRFMF